jgi:uncharacterized membrane protein YccF (DUF307 family)
LELTGIGCAHGYDFSRPIFLASSPRSRAPAKHAPALRAGLSRKTARLFAHRRLSPLTGAPYRFAQRKAINQRIDWRERLPLKYRSDRMPPVSILLNILWLLLGGVWMALAWVVAAVIMAITIIGLPWARAALNNAAYTLLPFGQKAVRRDSLTGHSDIGTGPLGLIGNLIWLALAGWWLALGHVVTAVLLAVTIIGIPFAWAHLKLAGIALWPIGKAIVPA